MGKLDQFREQFPDYALLSDDQLADFLYRQFYSDLDRDDFNKKIGHTPKDAEVDSGNKLGNIARAGVQGLSFGFGDEAEAALTALATGTGYQENVDRIRNQMDAFRETNPLLAYGSEFGGALLPSIFTGGAGLAAAGARGAAKVGGSALGRGATQAARATQASRSANPALGQTGRQAFQSRAMQGYDRATDVGAPMSGAPSNLRRVMDDVPPQAATPQGSRLAGRGGLVEDAVLDTGNLLSTTSRGRNLLSNPLLRDVAVRGAAQGALAGFGTAEGNVLDRLDNAAMGGLFGAALGGATKLLPAYKAGAKELVDQGINLTPGQALRAGPLDLLEMENLVAKLPFTSKAVRGAQDAAQDTFRRKYFEDIAGRLGQTISKEAKTGTEMFRELDDIVKKAYDTVLEKMSIPRSQVPEMTQKISNILDGSIGASLDDIRRFVNRTVYRGNQRGFLNGQHIREINTEFMKAMKNAGAQDAQVLGSIRQTILDYATSADDAIMQEFANVNSAFALFKPLRAAVASARTVDDQGVPTGNFTAANIRGKIVANDRTKKRTARGEMPQQDLAAQQARFFGERGKDSGTTGGLFGTAMIFNPLLSALPLSAVAGYQAPGATRSLLLAPGRAARAVQPALGYSAGMLGGNID